MSKHQVQSKPEVSDPVRHCIDGYPVFTCEAGSLDTTCIAVNSNLCNGLTSCSPYKFTIGKAVDKPGNIDHSTLTQVITAIQSGVTPYVDIRHSIQTIRNPKTYEQTRKAIKTNLPWFCASEIHTSRANQNVVQAQYMVFDLDHVAAIEALKKRAISLLPYVRYAFRSVHDGVKLIVVLDRAITEQEQFRHCYRLLAAEISTKLGLECDTTSDWARACFFSYDPAILDRKNCIPFAVVDLPLPPPTPETHAARGGGWIANVPVCGDPKGLVISSASGLVDTGTCRIQNKLDTSRVGSQTSSFAEQETCSKGSASSLVDTGTCRIQNKLDTSRVQSSSDEYQKAEQVVLQLVQIDIPYAEWIELGFALCSGFGERGKALWDLFEGCPHYQNTPQLLARKWYSFKPDGGITIATLYYIAKKYGVTV